MDARGYALKFLEALAHYSPDGTSNVANWEYAGSDRGPGLHYFRGKHPRLITIPPHADQCVCTHDIKKNCYISCKLVPDLVLVVGSDCVRRIKEADRGRKCLRCDEPRGSRPGNVCKECLRPKCRECGKPSYDGEVCYECQLPKCNDCDNRAKTPNSKHCAECAKKYCRKSPCDSHVVPGYEWCARCIRYCKECGSGMSPYLGCFYCADSVSFVEFGKYHNKTFQWVCENKPSYCEWVLREKPKYYFYHWLKKLNQKPESFW